MKESGNGRFFSINIYETPNKKNERSYEMFSIGVI